MSHPISGISKPQGGILKYRVVALLLSKVTTPTALHTVLKSLLNSTTTKLHPRAVFFIFYGTKCTISCISQLR